MASQTGRPLRRRLLGHYAKSGRFFRIRARAVVTAGGSWTSKHIVRDLPESHRQAYAQFYRSPCLMANIAVHNWRFLYERAFRAQLGDMFAPGGFDPRRDIAAIILNRWGHAYVNPQPGFFFGVDGKPAPRNVLRDRPHGRIAFANTDLAGAMDHRNSIREADRAVKQLIGT